MSLHWHSVFWACFASTLALTQAQPDFERDGRYRVAAVPAGEIPARPFVGKVMRAPAFDGGMGMPFGNSATVEKLKADCAKFKGVDGLGPPSTKFEKMCEHLNKMHARPKLWERIKAAPAQILHRFSPKNAEKRVALGCTSLLKAKGNGKLEWFERQPWYRKSLKMCTTLSGRSPEEIQTSMMKPKKELSHTAALRQQSPAELMKGTCEKLRSVAPNHEVRSWEWYSKAAQMCSTIGLKSPEELTAMVHRSQTQAETASGQLLKQTCDKLNAAKRNRDLDRFRRQTWYSGAIAMCAKFGERKVDSKSLASRCAWLANVERAGKDARVRNLPWYKDLATTCKWINSGDEHRGKKGTYPGNEGLRNKPVFV